MLDRIDDGQLDQLAAGLLGAPRGFVTGEGRSGFMARAFAMRLAHLGLPVAVLGETTTPPASDGDILVAVSGSGTTHGTVHQACHLALDAVCLHLARRTGTDNRQARSHHATIE